jgi:hypothetical protein
MRLLWSDQGRNATPGCAQLALEVRDRDRALWNTLAASAPSTSAALNTSAKCAGSPAPPEAISGTWQTARTAPQLREVVAIAHAIGAHAVEHDLAGAAFDCLAHPVEVRAARRRGALSGSPVYW